ncbi:MAG: Hsp20/alpha crystallin family protein [Candidatus Methanoplasma sp.]|jgi:HSP20 family protein|nr:Hsp20/alpha crystallin family protein [Candidatus Methanoplasma sp.]
MDTDDLWNDLFGGSFETMARRMEKMFSDMENLRGADVKTYGYTMYQDSEGNRHVKEFGNSVGDRGLSSDMIGEPLTDVSLEDGVVRAIVEIPGVSKEDIVLEGTKSTISVNVDTEKRRFSKTLALPCDVDPDSAKAEYNNGILEVTLTPMVPPDSKKRIDVQ